MIRRFHEAKILNKMDVTIWGTGIPRREFLYVDDMAAACVHVMNLDKSIYEANTLPMQSHINIGYGEDINIADLANSVGNIVGYSGQIKFDASKPDGAPRKLMNSSRLNALGWKPQVTLESGLKKTYEDFRANTDLLRME
jgi:GDP-L-fucose synthase